MNVRRRWWSILAATSATLAPIAITPDPIVVAQSTPASTAPTITYDLPGTRVYPQGIAVDPAAGVFFVGSTEDGTFIRGDLDSGEATVFGDAGADGPSAVNGLALAGDRLLATGRGTSAVFVYDAASGTLLHRLENRRSPETSVLNNIAVTRDGAAYVTDGANPVLYRIPPSTLDEAAPPDGRPPATSELDVFLEFTGTPFVYRDDPDSIDADGIAATADGSSLLIVQSNTGRLYRVEITTKQVTEVDLDGIRLDNADGMALVDRTLYVLRDADNLVARVAMAEDFASGRVEEAIADPSLDWPTAIAPVGDGTALVANHQPTTAPPRLPFVVTRLTLPPVS